MYKPTEVMSVLIIDNEKKRNNELYKILKIGFQEQKQELQLKKINIYISFYQFSKEKKLLVYNEKNAYKGKPTALRDFPKSFSLLLQHGKNTLDQNIEIGFSAAINVRYTGSPSGILSTDSYFGISREITANNIVSAFSYDDNAQELGRLKEIFLFTCTRKEIPSLFSPISKLNSKLESFYSKIEIETAYEEVINKAEAFFIAKGRLNMLFIDEASLEHEHSWKLLTRTLTERLRQKGFEGFISDFVEKHTQRIKNQGALCKFIEDRKIDDVDIVVLNAERPYGIRTELGFKGVHEIAHLRNRGFKGVILLTTAVAKELWDNKKEYQILNANYCFVYNLMGGKNPFSAEQKEDFEQLSRFRFPKMSERYLRDIRRYLIDKKGQLHEAFHMFKNNISSDSVPLDRKLNSFFLDVMPLFTFKQVGYILEIQKQVMSEVKEGEDVIVSLDKRMSQLESLIVVEKIKEQPPKKNEDCKILLLEDNQEKLVEIVEILAKNKFDVLSATSVIDAEKIIREKQIEVLIIDIRLVKNSGRWQIFQGYELLEASEEASVLPVIFLTSKTGYIFSAAEQNAIAQGHWFAKNRLMTQNGRSGFVKLVTELAEGNIWTPNTKVWNRNDSLNKSGERIKTVHRRYSYRLYYTYYRQHALYFRWEKTINLHISEFIKFFKKIMSFDGDIFNGRINEIDDLIPIDLQGSFAAIKEDYKNFNDDVIHFRDILKARRMVIALAYIFTSNDTDKVKSLRVLDDIYFVMRKGKDKKKADPKFFTKHLGISSSIKSIKNLDKMLLEEKRYFLHHPEVITHPNVQ